MLTGDDPLNAPPEPYERHCALWIGGGTCPSVVLGGYRGARAQRSRTIQGRPWTEEERSAKRNILGPWAEGPRRVRSEAPLRGSPWTEEERNVKRKSCHECFYFGMTLGNNKQLKPPQGDPYGSTVKCRKLSAKNAITGRKMDCKARYMPICSIPAAMSILPESWGA